jgi:hypothetical protein
MNQPLDGSQHSLASSTDLSMRGGEIESAADWQVRNGNKFLFCGPALLLIAPLS